MINAFPDASTYPIGMRLVRNIEMVSCQYRTESLERSRDIDHFHTNILWNLVNLSNFVIT